MAHNDRDRNRTGPLSLQVGQVTSAVDDLITGYEHIVDSLPQVASKVSEMHHGTTALAEELESKMSNLIDGYGYLQSVAIEMPESIRQLALENRKSLLNAVGKVSTIDPGFLEEQTYALESLRLELQTITEERIKSQVRTKLLLGSLSSSKVKPTLSFLRNKSSDVPSSSSSSSKAVDKQSQGSIRIVSSTPQFIDVNTPIPVPSYKPKLENDKREKEAKLESNFIAKNVGSRIVVPNVRIGSLPEEIGNIQTTPIDMPLYPEKRIVKKSKFKRLMTSKFHKTQADVKNLRETLMETSKRITEDQERARDELRSMLHGLQKNIKTHDDTVAQVLGKVIDETIRKVDHMTAEEARQGLERVKEVSHHTNVQQPRKIKVKFSDTSTDVESFTGYKTIVVGGKKSSESLVSPALLQLSETRGQQTQPAATSRDSNQIDGRQAAEMSIDHVEPVKHKLEKIESPVSVSSQSKDDGQETQSHNDNDVEPTSSNSYSLRLVGDKLHGIRWEKVRNNLGSPSNDLDTADVLAPAPINRYATRFNPYDMESEGRHGGRNIIIVSPDANIQVLEENDTALPSMIPSDTFEKGYGRAQITGSMFLPSKSPQNGDNATNTDQKEPFGNIDSTPRDVISELVNYQADDSNSVTGLSTYWTSRVIPMRYASKEANMPSPPVPETPQEIATPNAQSTSRLEQDLLQIIQSMMKSQQDMSAGTQAMMLTMMQSFHQERVNANESFIESQHQAQASLLEELFNKISSDNIERDRIIFELLQRPQGPSSNDIAQSFAESIKNMMTAIIQETSTAIDNNRSAPVVMPSPNIIVQTSTAPEQTRVILKDEDIQVNLDLDETNQEEKLSAKDIPKLVQEGVMHGIRDILDIICPDQEEINDLYESANNHDNIINHPNRGWNDMKSSIRNNIKTIDQLESIARQRQSSPNDDKPSPSVRLPDALLHVDPNNRVENHIESEMLESQRHLHHLRTQKQEDQCEDSDDDKMDDRVISKQRYRDAKVNIYRDTAIHELYHDHEMRSSQSDTISVNSSTSNHSMMRLKYNKLKKNKQVPSAKQSKRVPEIDKEPSKAILRVSSSDEMKYRSNPSNGFHLMPCILTSDIITQDATKFMIKFNESSLFGSEYEYSDGSPNIISGLSQHQYQDMLDDLAREGGDNERDIRPANYDRHMTESLSLDSSYESSNEIPLVYTSSSDDSIASNIPIPLIKRPIVVSIKRSSSKPQTSKNSQLTKRSINSEQSSSVYESEESKASLSLSESLVGISSLELDPIEREIMASQTNLLKLRQQKASKGVESHGVNKPRNQGNTARESLDNDSDVSSNQSMRSRSQGSGRSSGDNAISNYLPHINNANKNKNVRLWRPGQRK